MIDLTDRRMQEQWFETWLKAPRGGLRMPPEWITSVLLPDGAWHEIEPGSMDLVSTSVRFTEKTTRLKYSFDEASVIAVRGPKRQTSSR
jgi:hypothetical protein